MLNSENIYSNVSLECINEVKKMVRDFLHSDWALHIEYAECHQSPVLQWNRWGKALFAVKDASSLIDSIIVCRACNPDSQIRLFAEKFRPHTKFVYWIYTPNENTLNTIRRVKEIDLPVNQYRSFKKAGEYSIEHI